MTTRQTPDAVREAANVAAFHAFSGKDTDPFTRPEAFGYASEVAGAVVAALDSRAGDAGEVPDGAGERIKSYIAALLNAIQPFASAAEHAEAINAARDPAGEARVYPWNYVNLTHFADAFAIFSERLDPDDWAILTAAPAPALDAVPAGEVER